MFPMQYPNMSSARPPVQHSNTNRAQETSPMQLFQSHRNVDSSCHEAADSQKLRIFRMQQERLRSYGRITAQRPTDADALIQDIFKKEDFVKPSDMGRNASGFPQWCFMESRIPPLYATVEKLATKDGHLDTALLYPLLLSSGLHKAVLGHIWFLVNQTVPGVLRPHELYAALGLIALAQKGTTCNRLDVLNQFSIPPVPFLQLPQDTMRAPSFVTDVSSVCFPAHVEPPVLGSFGGPTCSSTTTSSTSDDEFADFLSGPTSDPLPVANASPVMPTGSSAVGNRLANYAKTTTKVAAPVSSFQNADESSQSDEEFADFQQAKENNPEPLVGLTSIKSEAKTADANLDKYSVFRELDQELHEKNKVQEEEEFGDFHTNCDKLEETIQVLHDLDFGRSTVPTTSADKWIIIDSKKMDVGKELSQFSCETSFDLLKKQAASFVPSVQLDPFSKDEGEEFGDFVSPLEIQDDFLLASPKDCFVENQSVSSLEFSPVENVALDSDTINDAVFHGSLSSLDKMTNEPVDFIRQPDAPDRDASIGLQLDEVDSAALPHEDQKSISSMMEAPDKGFHFALDRYALIGDETKHSDHERNFREWTICLESCKRFINDAYNIFTAISSQSVCAEVVTSEEGHNYCKNITEIYKLARRLYSTAQLTASKNERINQLVEEMDQMWHEIEELTSLSLELDDGDIEEDPEISCGVCLKNISGTSPLHKTDNLTYGGRQYHTTCANFWVNCVNSLLPALSFPHLL